MAPNSVDGGFPALAPNASQLPYAISHRGWALFGQVSFPLVGAFFALVVVGTLVTSHSSAGMNSVIAAIAVVVTAASGYRLWQLRSPWLVLYPDRLEKRGLTGWRTLSRASMLGYRTVSDRSGSWLVIIPKADRPEERPVRIRMSVRDDAVADRWFTGLRDLAAEARAAAKAVFLADPRYGADPAQREARLALAKKVAIGFNLACVAIGVVLFFWPPADLVTLAIAVATIAAALLLVQFSNGLLVWADPAGVRPPVFGAFAPAIAMAILGVRNFHVVEGGAMAVAAGFAALALAGVLYVYINRPSAVVSPTLSAGPTPAGRLAGNPFAMVVAVVAIGGFEFYGAGAFVNAALDASKVQVFPLTVQGKHASHGKSTTYYINVGPWSDQRGGDISTPESLYDDLSTGSTVCFFRQSGALGLAWFRVGQCAAGTPAPVPQADNPSTSSPTDSAELNNKANPN